MRLNPRLDIPFWKWRAQPFTLVEVLLAISVLAIGIVGVITAYTKSAETLQVAKENVDAYHLLEQRMAGVRLDFIKPGPISFGGSSGRFSKPYNHFSWQVRITSMSEEVNNLARVQSTVTNQHTGRTYQLTTFIRKDKAR